MFYLSQSEISFHIIVTEFNFGVGTSETICFAENSFFTSFEQKKIITVFLLAMNFQRIFFFVFDQSESWIASGGHIVWPLWTKWGCLKSFWLQLVI